MILRFTFFVYLFHLIIPSFSQDWFYYSTSNTLPNNNIRDIAIDAKNVKWLATGGGGLARFDGSIWRNYNQQNTDGQLKDNFLTCISIEESTNTKWIGTKTGIIAFNDHEWQEYNSVNTTGGLPASMINCIAIDNDGTKWIGTNNGLSQFKDKWITYLKNKPSGSIPSNKINCIVIDSKGVKWIGTSSGLAMYDGTNWKTFLKTNTPALLDDNITSLAIDPVNDALWIGTATSGILKFESGNWESFNSSTITNEGFSDNIRSMETDKTGRLLVTTLNGVMVKEGKAWKAIKKKGSKEIKFQNITIDIQNDIWVGTDSAGLWKYDGKDWENYNVSNGIPNDHVYTLSMDWEGSIWAGTNGGGLVKFNGSEWLLHNQETGLPDQNIQSIIIESRKNIYAGTVWFGLAKFDGEFWRVYNTSNSSLPNDNVTCMAMTNDEKGGIWIGTGGGGVALFDGEAWTIYNSYVTKGSIPDDEITAIALEKKKGILWVGTKAGLVRFDGQIWTAYNESHGLPSVRITAIAIDENNVKWVGTAKGLATYNDEEFKTFDKAEIPDNMIDLNVRSIFIEKDFKWIGTDYGLLKYKGNQWTHYTHHNTYGKLPSDIIYSITADRNGNKWIGTSNGLVKLANSESVSSIIGDADADGIIDNEDLCPTVYGAVTNRGCPEITGEERATINKVFSQLLFQTGEDVILKASYNSLNELAYLMKTHEAARLYIEGHTDDKGDPEVNLNLSKRRADAVKEYLIAKGIDGERIQTNGFGSLKPKTSNATEEGRQVNRRVELFLIENISADKKVVTEKLVKKKED